MNCFNFFSTGLCCAEKNDFCTPTWGVQVCKNRTLNFSHLYCIKYQFISFVLHKLSYMWYTAFHIVHMKCTGGQVYTSVWTFSFTHSSWRFWTYTKKSFKFSFLQGEDWEIWWSSCCEFPWRPPDGDSCKIFFVVLSCCFCCCCCCYSWHLL